MTSPLIIRALCPECLDETEVQHVNALGTQPDVIEAPGCCCECGSELILRAYDATASEHAIAEHELVGFTATRHAPYWTFVCGCGWRSLQACETRHDAAAAWARHAAVQYVRDGARELVAGTALAV